MKRKYSVSKKITDEMANQTIDEVKKVTGCEDVEFTDNYSYVVVKASDENITHVMNRAVNIFARVCDGANISFDSFVYED